jgi:hypothetical protein
MTQPAREPKIDELEKRIAALENLVCHLVYEIHPLKWNKMLTQEELTAWNELEHRHYVMTDQTEQGAEPGHGPAS